MSFRLSSAPLDPAALARTLADPRAGACVTFEGWVRNRNEGQPVRSLEYEAYPLLADKEGARIVGVTAEHRGAAFEACRYLIDEAKARVPIWKKEHYAGGTTAWINCASRGGFAGPQP